MDANVASGHHLVAFDSISARRALKDRNSHVRPLRQTSTSLLWLFSNWSKTWFETWGVTEETQFNCWPQSIIQTHCLSRRSGWTRGSCLSRAACKSLDALRQKTLCISCCRINIKNTFSSYTNHIPWWTRRSRLSDFTCQTWWPNITRLPQRSWRTRWSRKAWISLRSSNS